MACKIALGPISMLQGGRRCRYSNYKPQRKNKESVAGIALGEGSLSSQLRKVSHIIETIVILLCTLSLGPNFSFLVGSGKCLIQIPSATYPFTAVK